VQFYRERAYDTYNAAFFFDSTGSTRHASYRKTYLVRSPSASRSSIRLVRQPEWFGGFGHGTLPVYRLAEGGWRAHLLRIAFETCRAATGDGADFFSTSPTTPGSGSRPGPTSTRRIW